MPHLLEHNLRDHLDGQPPSSVNLLHGLLGQLRHQLPHDDVTDQVGILLQDQLVDVHEDSHTGLPDPGSHVTPAIGRVILHRGQNALEHRHKS